MIFQFDDYRKYLERVYRRRKERNSSYSLRAFAQALQLPISTLSAVLRHSKNLPEEAIPKITRALRLTEVKSRYFALLVEKERIKSPSRKKGIREELNSLKALAKRTQVSHQDNGFLKEWYKLGLVELGSINNFDLTPANAAHALAVDQEEIEAALASLVRLGVFRKDENNRHRKVVSGVMIESETLDLNFHKFHREMLEKTKASFSDQTKDERFFGSETFGFNQEQLPKAKELIEDFFNKMVALADQSSEKNAIYHLGVQLFRLTRSGAMK